MMPVPAERFLHLRRIPLNPAINSGVIDIHAAFGQHILQFTIADAIFAVSAYRPQNNVTIEIPAFEYTHQYHYWLKQQ